MSIKDLVEFVEKEISENLDLKKESASNDIFPAASLVETIDNEINRLYLMLEGANKTLEASWESIPLPTLSELGWADAGGKGKKVNPQRSEIEGFLNKIAPGNRLSTKLKQIQHVVDGDLKKVGIDVNEVDSMGEIISYLVFLKTLTFIIQSFNQASAGFTFESLMGVLVGGRQIPADTGTIADFVTSGGVYISLKLLTEGSSTIDGSFVQLVEDLLNPKMKGKMTYLVSLKSLVGEGDSLEGEVKFYEFSFTRTSLAPILMESVAGQRALEVADESSRALLDGGAQQHTRLDLNEFIFNFLASLKDNPTDRAEYERMAKDSILKQAPDADPEEWILRPEGQETYSSMFDPETFLESIPSEKLEILKIPYRYLKKKWNDYNNQQEKKYIKTKSGKKINPDYVPTEKEEYAVRASKVKFMRAQESVAWLESASGDDREYFENLQKYSRGYLQNKQFVVQQSTVIDVSKDLGSLIVGKEKTLKVLEKMITKVNKKMFETFESMKALSESLQKFFLNNLAIEYGQQAISSANKISRRTKSLMGDKKSE
jgi:hypothetical protein